VKRALAQIRQHPSRFGALILAIVISVGFVTTCLVFVETQSAILRDQIAASARKADIAVSPGKGEGAIDDEVVRKTLAAVPGVAEAAIDRTLYLAVNGEQVQAHTSLPDSLQWADLAEGAWPRSNDEIVIGSELAQQANLKIGDTVQISFNYSKLKSTTLRVSGIAKDVKAFFGSLGLAAYVTPEFVTQHADVGGAPLWLVKTAAGTSLDQVLRDATAAMAPYGDALVTETATGYAERAAKNMTSGIDVFQALIVVFGAIATLVGMLIIANTFAILIAQRRRQIGLMRAIGAQSGQVQRELLAEALVLGVIGSVVGVGVGIGLATGGTALLSGLDSGVHVPWTVAISFAVGVLVTVLAAWLPSIRSSSIRPLEALRVAATEGAKQRPGWVATVFAALFLVGGGALLVLTLNATSNTLAMAVGAAALLSLGVLLGAGWYVPGLVRLLGWIPARTGPTARLAVANAVRNPRRTTATCLALMLAVGLIATLQVGSASAKASAEAGIADQFPIALAVTSGTGEPLPSNLVDQVRQVKGVTGASAITIGTVEIDGDHWELAGVPDDLNTVKPGFTIAADDFIVAGLQAKGMGWEDGQRISLMVAGAKRDLTVRVDHLGDMASAVVAEKTLQSWHPDDTSSQVWAAVDTRDADAARTTMDDVTGLATGLQVDGAIAYIVMLTQVLDVLLAIATALLGAAVLIALIGVGNTLGLSVLERTRESALLRALGLQRAQLRATLAIEAVLLAIAGAVVGIAAGIGFGALGAWALLAEGGQPLVLRVSWQQLLVDAGIAVVAGLLASVLPARRAAMAAPTEALADE